MNEPAQMASGSTGPDRFITVAVVLGAALMLVAGVWALLAPASFADNVKFPEHERFVHDVGAFQIGIGLTLVLALIWRDPLAVVLASFLVGNTTHAVNHGIDLDQGGRGSDPWLLAALSIVTGVALVLRLRQTHYVVGRVGATSSAQLAPAWQIR